MKMKLKELKQIKFKGGNREIMKTKIKQEKGITLIALIVTIVVLLILAGVSVNAIFSDNGIIARAQNAQNKMNEAQQNDLTEINNLNNWIDQQTNTSKPSKTLTFSLNLSEIKLSSGGSLEWSISGIENISQVTILYKLASSDDSTYVTDYTGTEVSGTIFVWQKTTYMVKAIVKDKDGNEGTATATATISGSNEPSN